MTLPSDFDRDLWFDPLTFQGLIGVSLSRHKYAELFRADGFAKPMADVDTKARRMARFIGNLHKP